MTCTACGSIVDDDSLFCPVCGGGLRATKAIGSKGHPDLDYPDGCFETLAAGTPIVHPPLSKSQSAAVSQDIMVGATIDDKYRIEYLMGQGGMGAVYCATRTLIGDTVAIKILRGDQVADAVAVERFRREAQAAARLKHPNAVAIFDFGVSNEGVVFLVMEKVAGESLRTLVQREGPLTPSAVAEILTQICAALEAAHESNIVHRDLKPDNILVQFVTNGLRVKVLDFGIARIRDVSAAASNLTQAGAVMGTPHYMSPEQCLGEELDGRSDIYSLGVVLHEMLCGQVPFNSPVSTAVVIQHVSQPPPSLRTINLSIPAAVERVVLHALQKKREDRPQTAGDLAREFAVALGDGTSSRSLAVPSFQSGVSPEAAIPAQNGGTPAPTMLVATPAWVSRPTDAAVAPDNRSKRAKVAAAAAALLIVTIALGIWLVAGRQPSKASIKQSADEVLDPSPPPGMVYVAGGKFVMGSDNGPLSERPQHDVSTMPFFIDVNEVTCEEYQRFIVATGHPAPSTWINSHYPTEAAQQPVAGVCWDEANDYARWMGKRLPTEEEWERAARGVDGRRYPWGNEWREGLANVNSSGVGHPSDAGAHSLGKAPCGALDMVGNVWEWTSTSYLPYPGGQVTDQKPGDLKVIRGGCYMSSKDQATVTFRLGWPARPLSGETNYDQTGFRCAQDVVSSPAGFGTRAP